MKSSDRPTDTMLDLPAVGAPSFILGAVDDLAARGSVTLGLDGLPVLDAAAVSAMIVLLRAVRERGGTVRIAVSRPALIEQVRLFALDRIFDVVPRSHATPSGATESRGKIPVRRARPATVAVLALAALLGAAAPARSQDTYTAEQIVERVGEQNASLSSYEARVAVHFRLKTFPYFSQNLSGSTYYKRPDNFEVIFDSVPSYARGFDKLYTDIGDPLKWQIRFLLSRDGVREFNGRRDLVVRLVLKNRGNIEHEDVLVDPLTWHIDQMEWFYYNGGMISMSQDFIELGPYSVLGAQHLTIRIPHISALADSTFSNYKTNVAITDSVFTRQDRK